jgi:enediyne biosynthesis protein E4
MRTSGIDDRALCHRACPRVVLPAPKCACVSGALVAIGIALLAAPFPARALTFTNVTSAAGFNYTHGYTGTVSEERRCAGGVAVGDYNRDGWDDLYVVRGNIGSNLLFKNLGNGTFQEVGASAGVNISAADGSGPTFGDYDGDGWLDLMIGGVGTTLPRLFRNQTNGTFTEVTVASGINTFLSTISCTWGDYDRDGDLDLFLSHWGPIGSPDHMWRNNGNGTFTSVDSQIGLGILGEEGSDFTYTGNFVDINNDDWPDLLVASDFGRSKVFMNDGDGTFTNVTSAVISDENGMGAAVGDYDSDGDLDWFVSSIWDPNGVPEGSWGVSGNRLYRNTGSGVFQDVTTTAGVRQGWWGWASSFQDFDNDGRLDLLHVNGWNTVEFDRDSTRLWLGNPGGTFTERSFEFGLRDVTQGRGIGCFDYDRDGDIDIFIANNQQAPILYRNDGGNALKWLDVELAGPAPNRQGIGARIFATAGGVTQMRELRCASNYVSQDPARAHFGLGSALVVSELRVEWPNGVVTVLNGIGANQRLVLNPTATGVAGAADAAAPPAIHLGSAAPNPFFDETRVRLHLSEPASLAVRIYDASGRLVTTLVEGAEPAGDREIAWDGRSDAGARAAAGNYFLRLDTPTGVQTRPVTVIR